MTHAEIQFHLGFRRTLFIVSLLAGAAALFVPVRAVSAIPVEFGATGAFLSRSSDSFDTGLQKFRSRYMDPQPNAVQSTGMRNMQSSEAWVRFGDLLGDHSYIGFGAGVMDAPHPTINEVWPDQSYLFSRMSFDIPYFFLSYHYTDSLRLFRLDRRWRWELGGGVGFLPGVHWNVDGYQYDRNYYTGVYTVSQFSSRQLSRPGNFVRLEWAVRRDLGDYFFFRTGFSVQYARADYFDGTINNASGTWYVMGNGGLLPLSADELNTAATLLADPYFPRTGIPQIQDRAHVSFGTTGLFFSVGVRL